MLSIKIQDKWKKEQKRKTGKDRKEEKKRKKKHKYYLFNQYITSCLSRLQRHHSCTCAKIQKYIIYSNYL